MAPWIKEIPAHTIYGAMMDASKDYARYAKSRKDGFGLPRCKRRTQKSFYVLGNAITKNGIYPRLLGNLKSAEPLPNKPSDSRIMYIAGKWYLRTSHKINSTITENQGRVVSIDPGVRTFLTCFSDRSVSQIGEGQFKRIYRLLLHADRLKSSLSQMKCRQKKRAKLALSRLFVRIQNLVSDMHFQAISWLVDNFDIIIFPDGNFTSATDKLKRKIRSKTVRSLMGWAFAKFRNRLSDKCELLGKQLILVNESYTSKTINWTGEVRNIGGAKYITADGIKVNRDINGALGIMLKAMLAQPLQNVFVN